MPKKYDRVPTGIKGLDPLIEGGFPRGRTILVSGSCGTGKTVFATQFIYEGLTKHNEKGLYVTLDEGPKILREDMLKFGWDLKKFERSGRLAIVDVVTAKAGIISAEKYAVPHIGVNVDRLLGYIMDLCKEMNADRIVIDSIAGLGLRIGDEEKVRQTLLRLNHMLSKMKATAVITSEIPEQIFGSGPMIFSKYGVEEYIADGVIVLHYLGIGAESNRSLLIRKMRGTRHIEDILPMMITNKGIVVKRHEEVYKV